MSDKEVIDGIEPMDYEAEKRLKKQRIVRNEFEKCEKYGIPHRNM